MEQSIFSLQKASCWGRRAGGLRALRWCLPLTSQSATETLITNSIKHFVSGGVWLEEVGWRYPGAALVSAFDALWKAGLEIVGFDLKADEDHVKNVCPNSAPQQFMIGPKGRHEFLRNAQFQRCAMLDASH